MGTVVLVTLIAIGLVMLAGGSQVFADSLQGANQQRIGNYDVQMTTEPKSPAIGKPTNVLIRISGVDGQDLVDVPIVMRLAKDGAEISRTDPVTIPYGHYTHQFTFSQPGRYVLYLDLNDYSYSGQTLTFTFFINVAGTYDYLYIVVPSAVAVAVGTVGTLVFVKNRRKKNERKERKHVG